ncbi:MAG TPA: serine--tRNA ligase [Limnochordia bacterium]
MLDLRKIRTDPDTVRRGLAARGADFPLDALLAADERRRALLTEVEQLKARRNAASEAIARAKREGTPAEDAISRMRAVAERIRELDAELRDVEGRIRDWLLVMPNVPHASVPIGRDASENVEIRRKGTPRAFSFEPLPHWDLGVRLGILDFESASKVSGARFAFLRGDGARLERALIAFMLDIHTRERGYTEVYPPYLVTAESMVGTAQLPKFAEDMFRVEPGGYYLIPTAEVPLTNLHRDEILDGDRLPLRYAAYSPCFRAEAGAAGRDTRGLIRVHQFDKVELVRICRPEDSYKELEELLADAEAVLERLELPYRVMEMCSGDLGDKATKQYDPEVWMPSYGRYVEISSVSNFEDYQARRANMRFRPAPGAKAEFVHTLNASGLAVGRTLAAILENYQNADGTVTIPTALRPYMGGQERIGPNG